MATVRRYGPQMVSPQVAPRPELGRGREQSFAAFKNIFDSANEFLRPAVEQIQTSRGEQEALKAVNERGPEWGLRQIRGGTSSIAIGSSIRNQSMAAHGGPTNAAAEEWLQYSNQGATRNQALSPELVRVLGAVLPGMGISAEVISGGQPGIEEGGARVGSVRHDHGGAGDMIFRKDGRVLSLDNPDDIPILSAAVSGLRAAGATGIGMGRDYMGPSTIHVGFGAEAVWGAGGKGGNAPAWLRAAYNGSVQGRTPATVAVPNTPEYELETINSSTFEPRLPFTIRDAAFNKAADRVIGARAMSALEEGMQLAMRDADGDIGKLRENLDKVRSQIMAEIPTNLPGLATNVQEAFDRGALVAERNAVQLAERRVVQQQEAAFGQALAATQQEAERLALTGASPEELAAHMAQATDMLVQFGPRQEFEIAGRTYAADPTRAGTMSVDAIATKVAAISGSARRIMIEADFMRSQAPGQYVDEFRRQVFAGNSPLPAGESLDLLASMESKARTTESARRTEAERERKRLEEEMDTTINAYVSMTDAGVPVAIPAEERAAILAKLSPYPDLQRKAMLEFAVADAAVQTHGMNGNELMGYIGQVRADMTAAAERGELDLAGAAIIESLEDELKAVQDAVTAETIGLPLIQQLAMNGHLSENIDYDGLREQAAGNAELITTINEVEQFHRDAETLSGLSAAERDAVIEDARSSLATLAAQGQGYGSAALTTTRVLDRLEAWSDHRAELAKSDPVKFAQAAGIDLESFEDAQGLGDVGAILARRIDALSPATSLEGVDTPVPLTQAELDTLSEFYAEAPRGQRAAFLASIADLGSDQASAVFKRVGATEPSLYGAGMVYVMGNQEAAGIILRGATDVKLEGGSTADLANARSAALSPLMEANILDEEGIAELDTVAMAYARGKALADGGRAIEQRDIEDGYNVALGRQADGTGGMVETRYGVTILPKGWDSRRLTRAVKGITDDDLTRMARGMVVDAFDRPFTAKSLRDNIEALIPSPDDPNILVPLDADGGFFATLNGDAYGVLTFNLEELGK